MQRFHYISADLDKPEESARVVAETTVWNSGSPPDVVWCYAGGLRLTLPFVDVSVPRLREKMVNNYFTSVYMARAIIQAWLDTSSVDTSSAADARPIVGASQKAAAENTRRLLFTAPSIVFRSSTLYGTYSPTMEALRSLSDSLSQKMNLYAVTTPIRAHTVHPEAICAEPYVTGDNPEMMEFMKLMESYKGQGAKQVAQFYVRRLGISLIRITMTLLTKLAMYIIFGGSIGGGFWKGLLDLLITCVISLVMAFVRMAMDGMIRRWVREQWQRSKDR